MPDLHKTLSMERNVFQNSHSIYNAFIDNQIAHQSDIIISIYLAIF